ncbi:hypothetical protein TorRG33x02_348580 [Trema orientale]|uniref:Uncharacterized protein n=1 Tax=Trema orientale TaxID=63057 RepID=A0A2P5AJT0_TREOI|nr:hypothetical protein TorRG33x02_348580 [Trema orientale]
MGNHTGQWRSSTMAETASPENARILAFLAVFYREKIGREEREKERGE